MPRRDTSEKGFALADVQRVVTNKAYSSNNDLNAHGYALLIKRRRISPHGRRQYGELSQNVGGYGGAA